MNSRSRRILGALVVIVALGLLPSILNETDLRNFARFLVLVLAVLGVNVAVGAGGIVSLGHSVFVGVGAFAFVSLCEDLGVPILLALPFAALISGLVGVVLGFPSLRVRNSQYALVSFGYAIAFPPFARWCRTITGGPTGRTLERTIWVPDWLPLSDIEVRYAVAMLTVFACGLLATNYLSGRWGRSAKAQRDDALAAATFGVPISRSRSGVLGLSAGLSGMAGALSILLFPYANISEYTVMMSLRLYASAVIGGLGSAVGSLWGVISLWLLPTLGRLIGLGGGADLIFGLSVLLLSYSQVDGIVGLVREMRRRMTSGRNG